MAPAVGHPGEGEGRGLLNGSAVQQGGEHPHHDVGILVVERNEHDDPVRLSAADHAPLEAGHHELHGHDHEEDIESTRSTHPGRGAD